MWQVWGLPNVDTGELVLYPREDPPLIETTPDVAALWHEVQVCCCSMPFCHFGINASSD
jgi:hypothetical protein